MVHLLSHLQPRTHSCPIFDIPNYLSYCVPVGKTCLCRWQGIGGSPCSFNVQSVPVDANYHGIVQLNGFVACCKHTRSACVHYHAEKEGTASSILCREPKLEMKVLIQKGRATSEGMGLLEYNIVPF